MVFVPADPTSLVAFVAILVAVAASLPAGVAIASRRLGEAARRRTVAAAIGVAGWMAVTGAIAASGVLAAAPMPRLFIFFAASNGLAVLLGASPVGATLARGLPLAALVGFQAFRLPLELVLHAWVDDGTIPSTMTWTGRNFDVFTGIVALVTAPLVPRFRAIAWLPNVIGLALLANVARVAILSSPLPFAWQVRPPLQLAFHLPYAWIVPVCVAGALLGHIVLTRALLRRP